MENNVFDMEKSETLEDNNNYYFFRALNMGDNQDIKSVPSVYNEGHFLRIRTDRERTEESLKDDENIKYQVDSKLSLEEVYDHVRMHHRRDTNCISLSTSANVSVIYGRGAYNDRYVMVRVPKNEIGEKVINAGQYILEEIEKKIHESVAYLDNEPKSLETLKKIDDATTSEEIKAILEQRYTLKGKFDINKAKMEKGIIYSIGENRISNYKALNETQQLIRNKIIAKLTYLERKKLMLPIIPNMLNNNLLIQTMGSAFSSNEYIHYGDINGNDIVEVSKEMMDILSLIQQVKIEDRGVVRELTSEIIDKIKEKVKIDLNVSDIGDNIENDMEETCETEQGSMKYNNAEVVVKQLFYLSKAKVKAIRLARCIDKITNSNPRYKEILKYIADNGFTIEPEIVTRKNDINGYDLSGSVGMKVSNSMLVEGIKLLTEEELVGIICKVGKMNVKEILDNLSENIEDENNMLKARYFAEAIVNAYDLQLNSTTKHIRIAKILKDNGVDLVQIKTNVKALREIKQEGIDIKRIIEENGLDGEYRYGQHLMALRQSYKGTGNCIITDEEKVEARELGLILNEKEGIVAKHLRITKILIENGVEASKIPTKINSRHIKLGEIKQDGVNIEKIIAENDLDVDYNYGQSLAMVRAAYNGRARISISDLEKAELLELGIVSETKESAISKHLRIAKVLKENGINLQIVTTRINGKGVKLCEIQQDGIDIKKVIKDNGLDEDYSYGQSLHALRAAYNGNGHCVITASERKEAERLGLIKTKINGQEIGKATYDASVELCDEMDEALNRDLKSEIEERG